MTRSLRPAIRLPSWPDGLARTLDGRAESITLVLTSTDAPTHRRTDGSSAAVLKSARQVVRNDGSFFWVRAPVRASRVPSSCSRALAASSSTGRPRGTSWSYWPSTTRPTRVGRVSACAVKACIPATSWPGGGPGTRGVGRAGKGSLRGRCAGKTTLPTPWGPPSLC